MVKTLLKTMDEERKALRDGRELERLYSCGKDMILKFLNHDFVGSMGLVLESAKNSFEKIYGQIKDMETKYHEDHRELANLKKEFEEVHRGLCYDFAKKVNPWGKKPSN